MARRRSPPGLEVKRLATKEEVKTMVREYGLCQYKVGLNAGKGDTGKRIEYADDGLVKHAAIRTALDDLCAEITAERDQYRAEVANLLSQYLSKPMPQSGGPSECLLCQGQGPESGGRIRHVKGCPVPRLNQMINKRPE
jgi:hypothetical protein